MLQLTTEMDFTASARRQIYSCSVYTSSNTYMVSFAECGLTLMRGYLGDVIPFLHQNIYESSLA